MELQDFIGMVPDETRNLNLWHGQSTFLYFLRLLLCGVCQPGELVFAFSSLVKEEWTVLSVKSSRKSDVGA